jgi:5-methylcytosine-specific restriction enzyme subunit McrC
MFTYAQRYQCPRVVLLYPQADGGAPVRQSFEVLGGVIDVATISLQMDLRAERGRLISALRVILANEA